MLPTLRALVVLSAVLAAGPALAQPVDAVPDDCAMGQPERQAQAAAEPSAAPAAVAAEPSAGPEPGTEWTRTETGRQIPDPTGTRLFKPAISGGVGPRL